MQKNYLFAVVGLGVLLLIVIIVWQQQNQSPSVALTDSEAARFADATIVPYRNDNGAELTVAYVGDLARVTGGEYDGVTFRQVEAASGAKYEAENGVSLWTKGGEVRLETPQSVVYTGSEVVTTTPVVPDVPLELPPVVDATTTNATTTDATIVGPTWVWQEATVSGEPLLPKANTSFSVTFTPEGQVRGVTDCNGFGGDYILQGETITVGEFMSTMMYCEGSQESEFTALFKSPLTIVTVTSSELVVKNAAGDTITLVNQ
jgi:heat shock protein HslJ